MWSKSALAGSFSMISQHAAGLHPLGDLVGVFGLHVMRIGILRGNVGRDDDVNLRRLSSARVLAPDRALSLRAEFAEDMAEEGVPAVAQVVPFVVEVDLAAECVGRAAGC